MDSIGDSPWLGIPAIIVGAIVLAILGVAFALLFRGIDRKVVAHMQGRIGPPIVQPFRDVRKLLVKENIVPDGAVSWLFNGAPIVCLVVTILVLLYIPVFGQRAVLDGYGDAVLILYLLIVPSLAFVAGGFSSGSPYATVGAQREMVIMMSYEFSLALVIVAIAWRIVPVTNADPFMLSTIAAYPIWNLVGPLGIVGAVILLFALLTVTPGEVSKVPFDIAEAETEIAGGILVEYSGRNLALFYLSDVLKAFVMVSLVVALFFPYNLSPAIGIAAAIPAAIVDGLFFLVKVFVIMFVSVMVVRAAMARFKISQASYVYLIAMTLVSLVGLIFIGVDLAL